MIGLVLFIRGLSGGLGSSGNLKKMESVVIGSLVFLSSIIYDKSFGKKVKLNYCRILMQIQNSFIEWLVCEAVEGGGVFKEIILLL